MKTDTDLYRELGELTKNKAEWKTNICLVGALLEGRSPKVTAKAIWLLGEMETCAKLGAVTTHRPDALERLRNENNV